MKDKEKKNKKHHESTIGKIIYGFLLFLPLLAITSTILVNTFNKEVKQPTEEARITYKYESNEVNSNDDYVANNIYQFNLNGWSIEELIGTNEYITFELLTPLTITQNLLMEDYLEDIDEFAEHNILVFEFDGNDSYISLYYSLQQFENYDYSIKYIYNLNFTSNCVGKLLYWSNNINTFLSYTDYNEIENVEIIENETTDNDIFYYAVDKVTTSPLFNWTTNTSIYSTINQFTNNLGITNTFMPLLLTYWLIISIVYFLYDIVLMILVVLHRKIHELQDTI